MGRVMQEELVTWLSGMARVGTRASPRVVVYGFFADVCCSHHLEFPLLCLLPEPQGSTAVWFSEVSLASSCLLFCIP